MLGEANCTRSAAIKARRRDYESSRLFAIVPRACGADLDDGTGTGSSDAAADVNDLLMFLVWFEAGSTWSDLDNASGSGSPDGGVDVNDLLYFLEHFEAGV